MKLFKTTKFKLFLSICLILIPFITHYGGNYMADSMLAATQAILDQGTLNIEDYIKEGCMDTASKSTYGCDHALFKGKWYSGFAPGPSFLALPAYAILKPFMLLIPATIHGYPKPQIQTALLNILATILILIPLSAILSVLVYKISKHISEDKNKGIITALLFSFGTIFFIYSTEWDSRVLATFFSFMSFYLLFKARLTGRTCFIFLAGLLSGIAVTMEYMQVVILFILGIYLLTFIRDKRIIYFIIGAILPLIFMLIYHYALFENPLKTGYDFRQSEDKNVATNAFSSFSFSNLWSYTLSPKYGIFFYMPLLLLCVYGIYLGIKTKKEYWREWLVVAFIALAYLIIVSSFKSESPCTFGPRYLLGIIPFLFIGLPLAIKKIGKPITILIGAVSVFINILPALYMVENTGCKAGFNVLKGLIYQIPLKGFSNYTFNLINQEIMPLNYLIVNIITLALFALIGFGIWLIWKDK